MNSKQEEYKRNRKASEKAKLQRWKEEKGTPAANMRRMAFVRNIIYGKGFSIKDVAERAGLTPAGVTYGINYQDDMFISQIIRILKAAGVRCRVELHKKGDKNPSASIVDEPPFRFKGNIAQDVLKMNNSIPKYIAECTPDSTLYFLAQYYKECNKNVSSFCEEHGIYRVTLISNFRKDDIKLSSICNIARNGNAEIIWELNDE